MIPKVLLPLLTMAKLVARSPCAWAQSTSLSVALSTDELLDKPGGIRYLDAHQVILPGA